MNLCPNCREWEPRSDDSFCSWCGHRLISIQAELRRSRFSLADSPPPVDLVLSNKSDSASITVETIESSHSWIYLDLGSRKLPLKLAPHTQEVLTVQVDTLELPEKFHSGVIHVRTNVGEETLQVEVFPEPKLSISAYSGNEHRTNGRFDILLDNRNLERNLVRISVTQGIVVVKNVSTDHPEWVKARLLDGQSLPMTLDSRKPAYLEVFVDVDELVLTRMVAELPAEFAATLAIEGEQDFSHETPLIFDCRRPPELWIWEGNDTIKAWPGELGAIELTLQNSLPGNPQEGKGNASLQVTHVEIQQPNGKPCAWLKPPANFVLPIVVPGGDTCSIRFAFETDAEGKGEEDRLGFGRHAVVLVLTTNAPQVTQKQRFEVVVQPVVDFQGVLAIDFGTVNTCCAIFEDSRQQPDMVPIDLAGPQPTTAPTLIQYLRLSPEGEAAVSIGSAVQGQEFTRAIDSTARSPKRFLGTDKLFEVAFYQSPEIKERYPAKRVVCDYLREVRRAAERHHRGVRFNNIVVTHPARFRTLQIMELKEAVSGAFGTDCTIDLLPEPVAAALSFIMDPEALEQDRYIIGVFDFGGGTTDLCLLEVVNDRSNGYTDVRPRQLKSSGRWFGGEDLTRFVYQEGAKRCLEIAAADYSSQKLYLDPEGVTEGNQRRLAIENHGRLLQWAEHSKLLLIQHGDDHGGYLPPNPKLFPKLILSLWTGFGPQEQPFPHEHIVPRRDQLDAYLRPRLEELAADLQGLVAAAKIPGVNFIRLSGKPSSIPLVRQVLEERFPQVKIRPASEPKECVVQGACVKYQADFGVSSVLSFEHADFVQTTSRIGIEDAGKTFVEIIPLGVPVDETGLTGQYQRFPLRLGVRIRLLENASVTNNSISGNADITLLGTFRIDPACTALTRGRSVPSVLELRLSQNFTPTLVARVAEAEPVPFVLEEDRRIQNGAK